MQATMKSPVECPDISTYLPLLRTPGGSSDLLVRGSGLQARNSGDEYPIVESIPVLSPVEHHKVVATDVQEYYDKEAAVYNNTHGSALQGTQYNIDKHYGKLFEKYVRGADTVLEFGAGTGRFTKVFKPMVRSVIAADFSMPMRGKARGLGVPLVCADTQALPFASNTFDLLVGITTFSYVPNKAKAMAEFHRVLKPNGRLLMLDQNFGGFVMYLVSGYYFQSRKKTRPTEVKESTIANYKKLFQENDFSVDQTEVFSWVPHTVQAVGTKMYGVIDAIFSHDPVLRGQAMRLFITGRVQVTPANAKTQSVRRTARERGAAIDYASVPGGAAIASDAALRQRFDSVLDFVVPRGTTRQLMLAASSVYTALPEKLRQLAGRILFSGVLQEKIRAKLELPPDPALFAIAERMPEAPKTILLTHDVDWSTCYSTLLKLAEAEARAGVRACYYFLLKSGAYVIRRQELAELVAMGHEVGLHGLTYEIKLPIAARRASFATSRTRRPGSRTCSAGRSPGFATTVSACRTLS